MKLFLTDRREAILHAVLTEVLLSAVLALRLEHPGRMTVMRSSGGFLVDGVSCKRWYIHLKVSLLLLGMVVFVFRKSKVVHQIVNLGLFELGPVQLSLVIFFDYEQIVLIFDLGGTFHGSSLCIAIRSGTNVPDVVVVLLCRVLLWHGRPVS